MAYVVEIELIDNFNDINYRLSGMVIDKIKQTNLPFEANHGIIRLCIALFTKQTLWCMMKRYKFNVKFIAERHPYPHRVAYTFENPKEAIHFKLKWC